MITAELRQKLLTEADKALVAKLTGERKVVQLLVDAIERDIQNAGKWQKPVEWVQKRRTDLLFQVDKRILIDLELGAIDDKIVAAIEQAEADKKARKAQKNQRNAAGRLARAVQGPKKGKKTGEGAQWGTGTSRKALQQIKKRQKQKR